MVDLPNPPDPQQPVVRPGDGRVDEDWYRWFLAFVLAVTQLSALVEALEALAGEYTDCWQHYVPIVTNGDVTVVQKLPFAAEITSVVTDCTSGTCTVTAKIDNVALGGTANSVSSTETEQSHSSANDAAVGTTISYTVASNSSCLGMRVQINYKRSLG